MSSRIAFSTMFMGALLLSGCAKYRAQPLGRLNPAIMHKQESTIAFSYKKLSKAECKRYLDRDVIRKGYQPVQITLSNNTKRPLNFSLANISMDCVSAAEVGQKVHTSTVARATSYSVAGYFLCPLLLIPAVVDGVGSSQANEQLDDDFARKELCDQVIKPFDTINGLIFVPVEQFDHDFSITLVDAQTHDLYTLSTGQQTLHVA